MSAPGRSARSGGWTRRIAGLCLLAVLQPGVAPAQGGASPPEAAAERPAADPAAPQARRLAVLELHGPTDDDAQVLSLLTQQVRGSALTLPGEGWIILTRENQALLLPPDFQAADCLGACELELGRKMGVEVVVTGTLDRLGDLRQLSLVAQDTGTGRVLAQVHGSVAGPEALVAVSRETAQRLFVELARAAGPATGAAAPTASLTLRLTPGVERLSLNGIPLAALPLTLSQIRPTRHLLSLSGPCIRPTELSVSLAPGEARVLTPEAPPALRLARLELWTPEAQPVAPLTATLEWSVSGEAPRRLATLEQRAIEDGFEIPRCGARLRGRADARRVWEAAVVSDPEATAPITVQALVDAPPAQVELEPALELRTSERSLALGMLLVSLQLGATSVIFYAMGGRERTAEGEVSPLGGATIATGVLSGLVLFGAGILAATAKDARGDAW